MINKLIILGGHIQALGLARQAKPKGVRVELVIPDSYSVARFSHFVDDVHICKNEENLICCLKKYGSKGTMLFPTSDEYIDFIVRHYERLKKIFNIALPELSIVELFADKTKTYRFAEENDIRHPWSRYPQNIEDVEQMADDLEYPVVIKPAIMYDFHKKFGKKAFLCEDKGLLLSKVKVLVDADYPVTALIFQEFLSGGAKNLFSFGFFAVEGEVQSSITVNRIRQNPMDFGNSTTFAVTVDDKVIGSIGVFRQGNIHRLTAELGYYISEEYWGNGIMTEAVKQICEYVFRNSDIIRIYAEPFSYNTASCRVLEKAGFQFEGLLRHNAIKNNKVIDMKMYSLIKEQA